MDSPKHCPDCGAELAADAPNAPCPACLMKLGLESWEHRNSGDQTLSGGPAKPRQKFTPPEPSELTDQFPQYEIIELLGAGGMGAVYKARQRSLDRLVALKIINPEAADDSGFAGRFEREAKALARLNHSNIVGIHDFGIVGSLYFFVMEFVDGPNLRHLLESQELTPEQGLEIVPQLCEALQFAHDKGIVHRDIKPENVLLEVASSAGSSSTNVRVKIADFGLAKLLGDSTEDEQHLTATHQVMGTPRYMAPEQMEGSSTVDHRADIYSMGVVFYEMLTGELPLGRFALPSEKVAVDTRLDEVVLRSLEREPDQRYQQASELQTDLSSIDQPSLTTPPQRNESLIPAASPPPKKPADETAALRLVAGPGNGMIFVGIFELIPFALFVIVIPLLVPVVSREADRSSSAQTVPVKADIIGATIASETLTTVVVAQQAARPTFALLFVGIAFLSGLPLAVLFMIAGSQMKKLRHYPFALIGSIIAMLPCHPGFLIGLPIGIWSLVVLSRTDVRQAFQERATS